MGIKGILPTLEPAMVSCNLSSLAGQVAVVDVSIWLYRGLAVGKQQYVMNNLMILRQFDVTPIIVFDGDELEAKSEVNDKRRMSRRKLLVEEGLDGEDVVEVNWSRSSSRMKKYMQEVEDMCKKYGFSYVKAPYEADAQIAYMIANGLADFVITEDSDLIVYGCPKILFKMKGSTGKWFDADKFGVAWDAPFDLEKFRAVCIAMGCDYFPRGVYWFGLSKARKVYQDFNGKFEFRKFVKIIRKSTNTSVDSEFEAGFWRAVNTFKYQIVFDPNTKQCVPLKSYEIGTTQKNFKFAGDIATAKGAYWCPPASQKPTRMVTRSQPQICMICMECSESFPSLEALVYHKKSVHPFKCIPCDKVFTTRVLLNYHKRDAHPTTAPVKCPQCDKKFKTKKHVAGHVRRVHVTNDRLICNKCGKDFKNKTNLSLHIKNVHEATDRVFCKQCGKDYKTSVSLLVHMKLKHGTNGLFVCQHCGKGLNSKGALTRHTRVKHEVNDPVICPHCTKAFAEMAYLKRHIRTQHEAPHQFSCMQCDKGFRSEKLLSAHVKSFHDTSKEFVCPHCSKNFKLKVGLKRHIEVQHMKTDPSQCCHCGKDFRTKGSRDRHLREVHKILTRRQAEKRAGFLAFWL